MRTLLLAFAIACGGTPGFRITYGGTLPPALAPCDRLMPSSAIKAIAGLYSSPNPYSRVPEGALTIADDVVIPTAGVMEPRRGMPPSAQSFVADRCFPLPNTRNAVVTGRGAGAPSVYNPDADSITALARSGGLQPFGYPYQSDARTSVWGAAANGTLYLNGQQGMVAVTPTGWRQAGIPRPGVWQLSMDPSGVLAVTNFQPNLRRSYRLTFAWYDPAGNFYESEPSEIQYIENTADYGGTGVVTSPVISFEYPPMVPVGAFLRIWRAPETSVGVASSAEFFLVREYVDPLQATGSDGYAARASVQAVYDVSTDSLLNTPLYTNAQTGTGAGLLGQNTRPPSSAAVAWFKQKSYFARPTFQQSIVLQIIGTGTGGVQVGDAITIDGMTFTGTAAGGTKNIGTANIVTVGGAKTFDVATAWTTSQNIEYTARRLAAAINLFMGAFSNNPATPGARTGNPARQLYAYYASSGVNDFGRIVITRPIPSPLTDDPGIAFSVVTSSAGIRFPNGNTTSTDSYAPGGLSWSNYNQPEAVPAVNYTAVGDPNKAILGFAVLRDSMLIFKEQEGVYILYDTGAPLPTIQLLDPSAVCIAPQSIAVMNNSAYCLTARGVIQITEQSTELADDAVHADLQDLIFENQNFEATAWGAAYEAERQYILGLPIGPTENSCSAQWVLNAHTDSWTRWTKAGATSAMMLPVQQKLLMTYSAPLPPGNVVGNLPASGVYVERKGHVCSLDQCDLIGTLPAATYAGLVVPALASGAPPVVRALSTLTYAQDMHLQLFPGDLIEWRYTDTSDFKSRVQQARVVSVAKAVVSMDTASVISTDGAVLMSKAATVYRGVPAHWRFAQMAFGEPTSEKQWNMTQHAFRYFDGDWLDVQIDTEKSGAPTGFTKAAPDAKVANNSSTVDKTLWLRNTRDVILRVDPGQAEARGARIGLEFQFTQALASFTLVASSAGAGERKDRATR